MPARHLLPSVGSMTSCASSPSLLELAVEAWSQLPVELVEGIVPAQRDPGALPSNPPERRASASACP